MPTVVWLALLAGAYYVGRLDAPASPVPADAPRPEPLPLPPPDATGEPEDYSHEWEHALDQYEVDMYPPEAVPLKERLMLPPPVDGINVAAGCSAVAVGEHWWDEAERMADQLLYEENRTVSGATRAIVERLAPTCLLNRTPAAESFKREIYRRLSEAPPTRNPGTTLLTQS